MKTETPVIIVGGGPVGLATAIMLSNLGVASILVERKGSTSRHPKARGVNARAMELLRLIGCETPLRQAAEPAELVSAFATGDHLNAENFRRIPFGAADLDEITLTPAPGVVTSQDVVEEILYARARASSLTDVRFNTELVALEQTPEGVTAEVVCQKSGSYRIKANYLIAADGARSPIRTMIDSPLEGSEPLARNLNVMFQADLKNTLAQMKVAFIVVRQDERFAILSGRPTGRNDNQWTYNIQLEDGEQEEDFDEARFTEMIRRATDQADLEIQFDSVSAWTATARVARQLRAGKVFLVGDAAHMMPPAGALGMNTGLQDTHNLCWKLGLVLNGSATEALLDTYHSERHPICQQTVNAAKKNLSKLMTEGGREAMWGASQLGAILGFHYQSAAVIPDGEPLPEPDNPYTDYLPCGNPGCRAPHLPLRGRTGLSLLDLFGGKFVLLAARQGTDWSSAVSAATSAVGAACECFVVNEDLELADDGASFQHLYGVEDNGAVLVRPDGFIAWRARSYPENAGESLTTALQQLLGQPA